MTPQDKTLFKLVREQFTPQSCLGRLLINDTFECFTLEDVDRHLEDGISIKVPKQTAIPRGTYEITIDFSERFKRRMPHLLAVPKFTGIRIHSGNTVADTEGCILLGQTFHLNHNDNPDLNSFSIFHSKAAYEAFIPKLKQALQDNAKCWISIS